MKLQRPHDALVLVALLQSHRVIKFLMRIRSDLQKGGLSQSSIEDIQSRLRSLLKADHELMLDLNRLANTVHQMGRMDQETLRKTHVQLRGLGNVYANGNTTTKGEFRRKSDHYRSCAILSGP